MKNELREQGREAKRRSAQMKLTLAPLEADVNFAAQELQKNQRNQFWRRTVVRCLLAATEALLWNMRNVAPAVAAVSRVELTPHELEIINEKRVVLREGKTETRPYWLKFRDNIKATFEMFAKVHGVTLVWKDSADLDALCQTYELRNRLMHPKRPYDPEVSDSAIEAAQRGANWFVCEYERLMRESWESVPEIVNRRKSERQSHE